MDSALIRPLNAQALLHFGANGTRFEAQRCDLVGGITARVPVHLTPEQIVQDAMEMGAWHWITIVPHLKGFAGPGPITIVPDDDARHLREDPHLRMPLMKFFTRTRIARFTPLERDITRVVNCIEGMCISPLSMTLGQFHEKASRRHLLTLPRVGEKVVGVLQACLAEVDLALKD